MAERTESQLLATALIAVAVSALSAYLWKRKSRAFEAKIRELESSLKSASEKCASERQGRIRAQQNLRKTLTQPKFDDSETTAYPMTAIGTVRSCFSTRNGTPRQPLLVPLARACLVFDTSRVPPASLEGLSEYSHCWIIYVFHLNTNLEKLWRNPRESKFKAKVRVPRLKGGRIGVFSTRSPHRPCPIGLTVAKIEAVQGNMIFLSGADLVDGTPVLDIKPYLTYCDSVESASVPEWITGENLLAVDSVSFSEGFGPTLVNCWKKVGKHSLYASPDEFQSFIRQVLSWDIRSLSQRNRPHESVTADVDGDERSTNASDSDDHGGEAASDLGSKVSPIDSREIIYKLILEGLDIFYEINGNGNVIVHKISQSSAAISNSRQNGCNNLAWREKLT